MKSVEERLKEMIIDRYGTVKNFTEAVGIPNSTFANIMRRGVNNSNVTKIIKICNTLGISTDELAEGRIVPSKKDPVEQSTFEQLMENLKQSIRNADNLLIDGRPCTEDDKRMLMESIDGNVETYKKQLEIVRKYYNKLKDNDQ